MMFFNKKKLEQPINASVETDLFTDDFNEEDSFSTAVATSKPVVAASGSFSSGFQFPKLSPGTVASKIQSQQHGAFSSQSTALPNEDNVPPSEEVTSNQVQPVAIASAVAVEQPSPEVVLQSTTEAVVLETPFPAVKESAPAVAVSMFASAVPEPVELETFEPQASLSPSVPVDDFDMSLDLSSFAEEATDSTENFPDFSLDVPYLPEPEAMSPSLPPQAITAPVQISAHEIGSMVLDPLEDTADQISLQTRHAVAGTEAFTQTQFSPIDSSIDLTGLAVEDSYSTMAEANALNQDWVLQDIAVAEEQVALNAPQQPTLTGFTGVNEGASLETIDVSQFEAYETDLDFGMDFQENAQVALANPSIEPVAITETTWPIQPEPDFTLVEQTVTQATGITANDNLTVLDDAFDFADEAPIQERSVITENVTQVVEPIAQSVPALQESYQINEYDEVVVDFDSGSLAMDAMSAPEALLSSIGTVANEPAQPAHTVVNGVNEYDEVVVDFDSGTLALDATSAPEALLSAVDKAELIDPSFWVSLNGESTENAIVPPKSSTEDEFTNYVAAGFETSSKTAYSSESAQEESQIESTVANLEEGLPKEELVSNTISAPTDGMISLAEVVGSNLSFASKELGNILGLSAENQVLLEGAVLPFYDLELEKIKVVAAIPLEIQNSALLYLEIEPFFALFGFVNNQFKLLHTFQKNALAEVPNASLRLDLNATSRTDSCIYKLTIGLWEALVTVTPEQVNLVKILNHA